MPTRKQLEELLKSDPDDVFLQYALAMAYVSEGNKRDGLERLQQVIERDPDYVAAYFQKGQILMEEGVIEEARTVIARGIDAAKKVGNSHAETEMSAFLETL